MPPILAATIVTIGPACPSVVNRSRQPATGPAGPNFGLSRVQIAIVLLIQAVQALRGAPTEGNR